MIIPATSQHELTRQNLRTPEQLEAFGHLLIRACLHNQELFHMVAGTVNYDANEDKFVANDFMSGPQGTLDGLIFTGMQAYNAHRTGGTDWWPRNNIEWLNAFMPHLNERFRVNPDWPTHFLNEVAQAMVTGYRQPGVGEYDFVCDGLVDYVTGVRMDKFMAGAVHMDPFSRKDGMNKVLRGIRAPGSRPQMVDTASIAQSILSMVTSTHRIYSGVPEFDAHFGSKMSPGDAILGYGCSGGGKSVLACQMAGYTAAAEQGVLLISTEITREQCVLRACSAQQGISISALKSVQGTMDAANSDYGSHLVKWAETVGRNLSVLNYREMGGDTVWNKLEYAVESFERIHGRHPHLIIFDWIGKAADSGMALPDAWQKREHYNQIANGMADLADDLGNVTLSLAQGHPRIKNRTDLTEYDTADSTGLSAPMEMVLGITSLLDKSEDEQSRDVHRKQQYWVVPKCRSEADRRIPVLRRFEQQRFTGVPN